MLRPGGRIATVTDSRDDILSRRLLSSHFPEKIPVELRRYPGIPQLQEEMARAGFRNLRLAQVSYDYLLTDIAAYRDKAFSSLHLIDEAAFARGFARLESDLASGPIPCVSLYTVLWGLVRRHVPDARQSGQTLMFPAPAFADEPLSFSGTVEAVEDGRARLAFRIVRLADGETVCEATADILVGGGDESR